MYDYRLGLYEKAMPDDLCLEEKLLLTKRTGYDHMEFCVDLNPQREARLDWSKAERSYWRNFIFDNDIPLTTFSLSALRRLPLGLLDEQLNQQSFQMIEKAAKLACDLGSRVMLINGYDVYDECSTPQTVNRFYENLPIAVGICEKYGLILAIENAEREFCDSIAKAANYVDHIGSPYFCIYGDCGNSANFAQGDTPTALMDLASGKGRIAAMHLKDTLPGEYRFTPYGQGHVDFAQSIAMAKKLGVKLFTAELFYQPNTDYEAQARWVNNFLRGFFATEPKLQMV